ncbi:hypothetical protein ACHAXT_008004 [Thalassiosira profunda]
MAELRELPTFDTANGDEIEPTVATSVVTEVVLGQKGTARVVMAPLEEDEDDEEEESSSSSDESTAPPIPTTLRASPSHATLDDYTPKAAAARAAPSHQHGKGGQCAPGSRGWGAEAPVTPMEEEISVSTKIDVDDAVARYVKMRALLGSPVGTANGTGVSEGPLNGGDGHGNGFVCLHGTAIEVGDERAVPIVTCTSVGSSGERTVGPVDLGELKRVLEGERREDIGELYEALMRDLRGSEEGSEGGSDASNRSDLGSRGREGEGGEATSPREQVECLLECYASLAGGSTLPSTLGGSMRMEEEGTVFTVGRSEVVIETGGALPAGRGKAAAEKTKAKKKPSKPGFLSRKFSSGRKSPPPADDKKKSSEKKGRGTKKADAKKKRDVQKPTANKSSAKKAHGNAAGRPGGFRRLFSTKERRAATASKGKQERKNAAKKAGAAEAAASAFAAASTPGGGDPPPPDGGNQTPLPTATSDARSVGTGATDQTARLIDDAATVLASLVVGAREGPLDWTAVATEGSSDDDVTSGGVNGSDDVTGDATDGEEDEEVVSVALTTTEGKACDGYEVVQGQSAGAKDRIVASRPCFGPRAGAKEATDDAEASGAGEAKCAAAAASGRATNSAKGPTPNQPAKPSKEPPVEQATATDGLFDDARSRRSARTLLADGEVAPRSVRKSTRKLFVEKQTKARRKPAAARGVAPEGRAVASTSRAEKSVRSSKSARRKTKAAAGGGRSIQSKKRSPPVRPAASDNEASFVEPEPSKEPAPPASKGAADWLNCHAEARSYESHAAEARQDDDETTNEGLDGGIAWIDWAALANKGENAARDAGIDTEALFDYWNAAVGSSVDDADLELRDDAPRDGAADEGGWFAPLAHFLGSSQLGDLGRTPAAETDDEVERRDERSRRSRRSRKGRRSKSASRSRRGQSRSDGRSEAGRSRSRSRKSKASRRSRSRRSSAGKSHRRKEAEEEMVAVH